MFADSQHKNLGKLDSTSPKKEGVLITCRKSSQKIDQDLQKPNPTLEPVQVLFV